MTVQMWSKHSRVLDGEAPVTAVLGCGDLREADIS